MSTTAFIPARAGSKRIPGKNTKLFCGRPLIYWVLDAACKCQHIDSVVVSTNDPEINLAVGKYRQLGHEKIKVFWRSKKTATDTATTESAMLEYFKNNKCETVVLIQCTSPLLEPDDLEKSLYYFEHVQYIDSIVSITRQHRFQWCPYVLENLSLSSPNYKLNDRPMGQVHNKPLQVENGAFYITKYAKLLDSGLRVSGNVATYTMPEYTYLEVDTMLDFVAIEAIKRELLRCRNGSTRE